MSLGSGLSLDEQFDLAIDPSTGDIAGERESDELQKDLAFNVTRLLSGSVSGVITDGVLADIKISVRKVLQSDPRVESVESLSVTSVPDENGVVRVDAEVVATDGTEFQQAITA